MADYTLTARFLCVFAVFQKGLTPPIQTNPTVTAAAGDQARLDCQLMEPKDVHQVTWQKILPSGGRNVATYNKYFGPRVDPYFVERVELKGGGLDNSSIVIREATVQDEGCYHCLFNTYPDGALTGTTCLQVHELHGPFLQIRESNSTEAVVVSCTATGRPAPTVTITAPQRDFFVLNNSSISVTNNNSTVTVTETAVLSRVHYNSTQVGCAAQVLSAPQKEVFMMIPEVRHTPTGDGKKHVQSHRLTDP
ncbi:OX-2 membrane glycoprotein-like [Notolabrus celidotus]|uniref:OX-2 membrane glycoprotein-like n=1 Tax=Notolabrus celidotus TaxID=1203425 RepID=UPI0014906A9E|nr:OX-2 membrane glycoprotein-like [Notolabrus celidotus]